MDGEEMFQSPLGEVVKETRVDAIETPGRFTFQSPLGEVVKETLILRNTLSGPLLRFNPLSGKW